MRSPKPFGSLSATIFSRPVTRSDITADYAATQFIAEVLRTKGYDGLISYGAFALTGYNIALFDLDAALQTETCLSQVNFPTFGFRKPILD